MTCAHTRARDCVAWFMPPWRIAMMPDEGRCVCFVNVVYLRAALTDPAGVGRLYVSRDLRMLSSVFDRGWLGPSVSHTSCSCIHKGCTTLTVSRPTKHTTADLTQADIRCGRSFPRFPPGRTCLVKQPAARICGRCGAVWVRPRQRSARTAAACGSQP